MTRLEKEKLHVTYAGGTNPERLSYPRRYTLTHSDRTGDLFLTIGGDYNRKQISGLYTRLMRDEVIAELKEDEDGPSLHVYCHVSGGFSFGGGRWRESIFRSEMPLVLEALRYGDRTLFDSNKELDDAPVRIHFQMAKSKNNKVEQWGVAADYRA